MYLLDSNIFIESRKSKYPFELFPSVWNWFIEQANSGFARTINYCHKELGDGKDELVKWIGDNLPKEFIWNLDKEAEVVNNYRQVIRWSQLSTFYNDNAKRKFAAKADPWLVAAAMAPHDKFTIVTLEQSSIKPGTIKIPDVCDQHGAKCKDLFDMMLDLKAKF